MRVKKRWRKWHSRQRKENCSIINWNFSFRFIFSSSMTFGRSFFLSMSVGILCLEKNKRQCFSPLLFKEVFGWNKRAHHLLSVSFCFFRRDSSLLEIKCYPWMIPCRFMRQTKQEERDAASAAKKKKRHQVTFYLLRSFTSKAMKKKDKSFSFSILLNMISLFLATLIRNSLESAQTLGLKMKEAPLGDHIKFQFWRKCLSCLSTGDTLLLDPLRFLSFLRQEFTF